LDWLRAIGPGYQNKASAILMVSPLSAAIILVHVAFDGFTLSPVGEICARRGMVLVAFGLLALTMLYTIDQIDPHCVIYADFVGCTHAIAWHVRGGQTTASEKACAR
jgi:hypothetical protein